MSSQNLVCSHCGKPLKNQICFACEGKGYSRVAFIKKDCAVCHGNGRVWRCEDEFKHIVDDFKASHQDTSGLSVRRPRRSHPKDSEEIPAWEPTPVRPMNPENPWNFNNLGIHDTSQNTASAKHRLNRNAVKK